MPVLSGTHLSVSVSPGMIRSSADRRDKPPILRVIVLLVALVSTALALAALSPSAPEGAAATAVQSGPAADGKP